MHIVSRAALFGALMLAPTAAFAWWPFMPTLPEAAARDIAMGQGFVVIEDVDRTVDADWHVSGRDAWGHEVEIVIDGRTGAIERAEMESN